MKRGKGLKSFFYCRFLLSEFYAQSAQTGGLCRHCRCGWYNILQFIYLFNTINSTLNPRHNRQSRGGWWPRWVWACRRCPPMRSWGCICRPIRGRGRSTAPSPSRCHTPAWPRPCCRPGQASHCRGGRGDTAPSSPRGSSERSGLGSFQNLHR